MFRDTLYYMHVMDFPIIPFGKEMCHHFKEIKAHKVQESVGLAVGYKHPIVQGVTGQPKINHFIMCLIASAY